MPSLGFTQPLSSSLSGSTDQLYPKVGSGFRLPPLRPPNALTPRNDTVKVPDKGNRNAKSFPISASDMSLIGTKALQNNNLTQNGNNK